MTERNHVVSLHYIDEDDPEDPQLVQMRLMAKGNLRDPMHRQKLHWLLDVIIEALEDPENQ